MQNEGRGERGPAGSVGQISWGQTTVKALVDIATAWVALGTKGSQLTVADRGVGVGRDLPYGLGS